MTNIKRKIFSGFGQRLRQIRALLNLSNRAMAQELGITASAYHRNEQGLTFPCYSSLNLMQKDFDISMDGLMVDV